MDVRMCSKCGSPIPPQRLEALPETTHCVGCSCVKCRSVLDVELDGLEQGELVKAVMDVPTGE